MDLHQTLLWIGAVGSALMAGTFLAFSTFIMPAFARLEDAEGMRAMQTINVTVFHPLFMGPFLGTALGCALALALPWFTDVPDLQTAGLAGALLYLLGVFGVTAAGNVPWNDRLEKADAGDLASAPLWRGYLASWTRWNHLRSACSLAAWVAFTLALLAARG